MQDTNIVLSLLRTATGRAHETRDAIAAEKKNAYACVLVGHANTDVLMLQTDIGELNELRTATLQALAQAPHVLEARTYLGKGKQLVPKLAGFTGHLFLSPEQAPKLDALAPQLAERGDVLLVGRLCGDIGGIVMTQLNDANWDTLFSVRDFLTKSGIAVMSGGACP